MTSIFEFVKCRSQPLGRRVAPAASGAVHRPTRSLRLHLSDGLTLVGRWPDKNDAAGPLGSVFNVVYRPDDGRTLLALCEQNAIAVLDYRTLKPLLVNFNAHDASVNVATFLSDTTFVSGSDGGECRVWDLRRPLTQLCDLDTQAGSVKNVELLEEKRLLAVSGFSSQLSFWDTRTLLPSDECPSWSTDGLMRMRVANGGRSLLLAYRSLLLHVRDFEPSTLRADLPDLAPDAGERPSRAESANRNWPQVANDFVPDSDVESVNLSSLAVHPTGGLLASRGLNYRGFEFDWTSPVPIRCYTYLHTLLPHPRLVATFEEPVAAPDVIKEINFSRCGRYFASPFARGFRVFANKTFDCLADDADSIRPVATVLGTESSVVTSDFSPVYELHAAVGTKSGVVHFVQPRY